MITTKKVLVGELTKKQEILLDKIRPVSIKSLIERNGSAVINNPRTVVEVHVDGEKAFDQIVFFDEDGHMYACGKISAATNAIDYIAAMGEEDFALEFSMKTSKKSGFAYMTVSVL